MSLAELSLNSRNPRGFALEDPSPRIDFRDEGEISDDEDDLDQDEESPDPFVGSKELFGAVADLRNRGDLETKSGRYLQNYPEFCDHSNPSRLIRRPEGESDVAEHASPPDRAADLEVAVAREHAPHVAASPTLDPPRSALWTGPSRALQWLKLWFKSVSRAETVLESFEGYVDSVDGDTAYVTLESLEHGDVLHGEYSASALLRKGITEQTRFLCQTVKVGEATRIDFQALPKRVVTDDEARAIAAEMHGAFPSDDSGVRY